ncbi:hypothetical protein E5F05_13055 [Deinococcus metallilatus]|uniref:OstA family protein n=1 Tax=Deinococcus metallilatus TaxID=1211322 RepID=A0AAJ5JYD5_9DEIO|nr:hypothetical protein [Deinococcus metallilatus]MBB5297400.1 hypothetical protein [Deinococcus metallilatus]QBY08782.1 hypothetical protein E5F05_13055 [Deinococcus metallilatus]RXJ10663.1 hypothetical protein ERJ73_11885 [Deinococcus metallilatus]TLK26633.1 hypothetical protein FCS05_11635 [Deinococcus metallilatus]GMA17050.1 hypothetical protein GCM10025871_33810 [Deinococcus metallilatus]
MHRLLLSLLASLTLGAGSAVTFGGLNVTPRGPQNLNLETGTTDLPQGGTATDARTGLRLSAAHIQLKPGDLLNAQDATLTTRQGGSLRASNVTYDLKRGTVTASGGVTYTDARLKDLRASRLVLHLKTGFVSALGGVKAQAPALSGAALAFDATTAQAVLSGPYQYQLPPQPAIQGRAGESLLLTFSGNRLLRANPKPDAATLARFAPYLK